MDDHPADSAPPRRILLATDLTSACDRALDRAVALARHWDAALHLLHVVEVPPPAIPLGVDADHYLQRFPDAKDEALRRLHRDVLPVALGAAVHIEQGTTPSAAILEVVERERCDLLVLGEPRRRLVGPLGESGLDRVVRQSPASVLVVRDRPHNPYRNLLVGTDFTDEALQALVAVAGLFPTAAITLMHAYEEAYAYLLEGTPDGRDWPLQQLARLREQVEAAALPAARQAGIRNAVASGPPEVMLRRHVLAANIDLTVIGAYPRGLLYSAAVGRSRNIIDAIPGDVLVVRATRGAGR
ncbi:universal stress protein [Aerolutibacter ruishenii]|uniref:Nucleotide-binding universal stress UspA family protein n=1 Tax=Aerolutibacter ruishenii TaxID=686800 RepID=A0A562LKR1_9GAMM|nr:universal stress protein [Lysobacter ruishenii]TWI08204.1 nucleotide-binding universal stress UspA family protein [Lysobacter ruishenii]